MTGLGNNSTSGIDEHVETWRLRFAKEGFDFDDIDEIGIYPVIIVPYRRHQSRKRDQREFNAYPITYWPEIDPIAIDDYSRACYMHFSIQEKNIMRTSIQDYSIVVFPIIASDNVDSIAISHVQRYHIDRRNDIEFPAIFDLELERIYMRRTNPGKGDPFFDPYRAEVEYLLKG